MSKVTSRFIWNLIVIFACFTVFLGVRTTAQETVLWSKTDADPYTHAVFSHDGSILALGRGDSNTSDFLNASNGTLIRSFAGRHNTTNTMVFTLDDQYLITGVGQGGSTLTLSLWSVSNATRLALLGDHTNGDHSLSLSTDGQYVATSGNFGRDVKIWHVPDMTLINTIPNDNPDFPGIAQRVKGVAFSPDGQFVASSDVHGITFWGPFSGVRLRSILATEAPAIAISPDGQYIAGALRDERVVKLWRTSDGVLVRTLTVDTPFDFPVIAFSPNGRLLAAGYNTGADAGALEFWRVSTGRVVSLENKSGAIISLAFSPKGGTIAYTQFDGKVVMALAPSSW